MKDDKDTAKSQAKAQLDSIKEMVAALDVDYDRLEELRELKESHNSMGEGFNALWAETYAEESEELAELEDAAGDCESEDDARQRIEEDALSVEVRSDWCSVGDDFEAAEYRILLCTGGPHVELVGSLNMYGEPERARLFYRDWFEGNQELIVTGDDHDALIAYASCFYFGE